MHTPLRVTPSGCTQTYIAVALLAIIAGYCLFFERSIYALSYSLLIFAILLFVIGRILTASTLLLIITSSIILTSIIKEYVLQVALHSSDVLLISNKDMQTYLWSDQRIYMVALSASVVLVVVLVSLLYRRDRSFIPRIFSFGVAFVSLIGITFAYERGENPQFNFTNVNRHLSNFYASINETAGIFENKSYFDISNSVIRTRPINLVRCQPTTDPPNIILIHEESLFPPRLYQDIKYDHSIDSFFQSPDKRIHWLRTETFGSGSWLTEFSVLSGLSTEAFGGVRNMAPAIMTGKLGDSLPQWLKLCGYRNIEFNPLPEGFAFAGRFHRSIGFDLIMDKKAQKAKTFNERDRYYFDNAIAEMRMHFKNNSAPLFTYIVTMAAHYPYNYTYAPEEKISGGSADSVPAMNEYLRRMYLAVSDYRSFVAALRSNFPDKKFLIVHYGDHQPIITADLAAKIGDGLGDPENSVGYLTYFAVDAVNYTTPDLPKTNIVDIPYLGSLTLRLARLPLNEATVERLKLLEECNGRYAHCKRKDLVIAFQNRLFASGALKVH